MKRGVNWIEKEKIDTKCLKSRNRLTLGLSISGTKCDRDKPIFFAERGGQSDCVEV